MAMRVEEDSRRLREQGQQSSESAPQQDSSAAVGKSEAARRQEAELYEARQKREMEVCCTETSELNRSFMSE
eukprot:3190190-Amphidinium_carterae.1